MLHLGDLKKAGEPAPSPGRGRDAQAVPDWPARFAELAAAARDGRLRAFYAAGTVAGAAPSAANTTSFDSAAPATRKLRLDCMARP